MEDITATTFARDFGTNAWKWTTMFIKHHGNIILEQSFLNIFGGTTWNYLTNIKCRFNGRV